MQMELTTTHNTDAGLVDSAASWSDFHLATTGNRFICGLTAAISRGWTSLNMHSRRHIGIVSGHVEAEETVDGVTFIYHGFSSDIGVETRVDMDGNEYRISSIELTLVDIACMSEDLGDDVVEEVYEGAFVGGHQAPDIGKMMLLAAGNGTHCVNQVSKFIAAYI